MKLKRILSISLALLINTGICANASANMESMDSYIPIYNAEDLCNIQNNYSGNYELMNDIDLSSITDWEPIGNSSEAFTGVLEGNGYSIKNLDINSETDSVGLFYNIENAEIKDLTIENAKINIDTTKAISAGILSGQSSNSFIDNCETIGTITVNSEDNVDIGGIVGLNWANSKAELEFVGIRNCSNNVNINVMGLSGSKNTVKHIYVGGIAGKSYASIIQSSNEGNIFLSNNDKDALIVNTSGGGICGYTSGGINDCYNTGTVQVNGTDFAVAGGIAGFWASECDNSNLYNVGNVNAVTSSSDSLLAIGAIIGYEESYVEPANARTLSRVVLTNSYYIDSTIDAIGLCGSCYSNNVKMLSKEEFNNQESFAGFDFENTWEMNDEMERPVHQVKNVDEPNEDQIDEPIKDPVEEPSDTSTLNWFTKAWKDFIGFFTNTVQNIFQWIKF